MFNLLYCKPSPCINSRYPFNNSVSEIPLLPLFFIDEKWNNSKFNLCRIHQLKAGDDLNIGGLAQNPYIWSEGSRASSMEYK